MTYDPIRALLNADSEDDRDELTERWKDNKLQELDFVSIVVSNWMFESRFLLFLSMAVFPFAYPAGSWHTFYSRRRARWVAHVHRILAFSPPQ